MVVPFRTTELDDLAHTWVTSPGVAPACSLAVAHGKDGRWAFLGGAAGIRSTLSPEPVDSDTPFDLASVTKPLVACAAARLVRAGTLSWGTSLCAPVPELAGTAAANATLMALLSHRAGLEAHLPLHEMGDAGGAPMRTMALTQAANAVRVECRSAGAGPDGYAPLYSDLGYLLVGEMMSRAAGAPLAAIVEREVLAPLRLDIATSRRWTERNSSFSSRVAPTEIVAFRGGEVVGVVHDENAWALAQDEQEGHAGLFGTAFGVAAFGANVLDALAGRAGDWLRPAEVEPLVRVRPGGTLRAGFDGRAESGSSAGDQFGARAFGHLGFTGTSLWCDPDASVVCVILTNRVHPSRSNVAIRSVRPRLNEALFRLAVTHPPDSGGLLR